MVTQVIVNHAWLNLRDSLESAATAWYLAELADRSLEERHAAEPLYALLRRAYELLDAEMAPGRVARWYEMHLLDELGQRPEVDRCVECDRVLEADERFRWVPPLGGILCERCPGPRARADGDLARGGEAAQGLPAARHRGDRGAPRWRPTSNARPRPRCATSCASRSSARHGRWRSSTRSGTCWRPRWLMTGARGALAIGLAGAATAATAVGARVVGRALVGRTEARHCTTRIRPPYLASDRARALHERLWVADLHADSLLWGRDLLRRSDRGHVDVPRLIEGNVALQVLAVTTKSPRHLNLERNDDRSDDVLLLALALGWPPATWRRLLPRALHLAARADAMAARSGGPVHDHPLESGPGGVRSGPAGSARRDRRAALDRGRARAR